MKTFVMSYNTDGGKLITTTCKAQTLEYAYFTFKANLSTDIAKQSLVSEPYNTNCLFACLEIDTLNKISL